MRVTVVRAYGPYRRGAEIDPPDGVANLLIRRGLVEAIATEAIAAAPASQLDKPAKAKPVRR